MAKACSEEACATYNAVGCCYISMVLYSALLTEGKPKFDTPSSLALLCLCRVPPPPSTVIIICREQREETASLYAGPLLALLLKNLGYERGPVDRFDWLILCDLSPHDGPTHEWLTAPFFFQTLARSR